MDAATSLSDAELASAAARGDREAIAVLFRRHWASAHRTATTLVGSSSAGEDIAQEAFERALRSARSFDGRAPFAAWLQRIVVNRAIDHLRRRRPALGLGAVADVPAPPGAEPDPELRAAVAALSPDRRAAVVLRYWLDHTPAEIAELLGVPVGTVHSRLARALAELRATIEVS